MVGCIALDLDQRVFARAAQCFPDRRPAHWFGPTCEPMGRAIRPFLEGASVLHGVRNASLRLCSCSAMKHHRDIGNTCHSVIVGFVGKPFTPPNCGIHVESLFMS